MKLLTFSSPKIGGKVLFFIGFILTLLGCFDVVKNKNIVNPYKNIEISKYKNEIKTISENFVFLYKKISPNFECDEKIHGVSCEPIITSSASGLILSGKKGSVYVLTAGHFCANNNNSPYAIESIHGVASGLDRKLHLVAVDYQNDICLLMGVKYRSESYNSIKIANSVPKIGEEVYNISAPDGIFHPNIRLVFEGTFSGCADNICMFTVPATFGSSGSGIFNKNGELLTIVMAVPIDFKHVTISPSHEILKSFINKINNTLDIY